VGEQYADLTLGRLLDGVAARQPAPGGGSVAAIALSFAAGLVAMAARFSDRHLDDAAEVASRADRIRAEATELATADAQAYGEVLRSGRSGEALRRAIEVPLQVCRRGAEVADSAVRVVRDGNPNLRGDAMTGMLLADAAVRSAAYLVRLNANTADDLGSYTHQAEEQVITTAAALRRSGGLAE
jgi:methenyltetrahydrofolate cyclohydrolase